MSKNVLIRFALAICFLFISCGNSQNVFPDKSINIHPYISFHLFGNTFQYEQFSNKLYFGMTSNKIFSVDFEAPENTPFDVIDLEDDPGVEIKTGTFDINGPYIFVANGWGKKIYIYRKADGGKVAEFDFDPERILSFKKYVKTAPNHYYIGIMETKKDSAAVVEFIFNPVKPENSEYNLIRIPHKDINCTYALALIENFLFASTDKGSVIRINLNDTNDIKFIPVDDTQNDVRVMTVARQDNEARLFIVTSSKDDNQRFVRISNPKSSDPIVDKYKIKAVRPTRMYVYGDRIFMNCGVYYSFSQDRIFQKGSESWPCGKEFFGGYNKWQEHFLIGWDKESERDKGGSSGEINFTKTLIRKKIAVTNEPPTYKEFKDVPVEDDAIMLLSIESRADKLYTSAYMDHFYHIYNTTTNSVERILPVLTSSPVIKTINVDAANQDYVFYGTSPGEFRPRIFIVDRNNEIIGGDVRKFPDKFNDGFGLRKDANYWGRVTAITDDAENVYFGTGEHVLSISSNTRDAVIVYEQEANLIRPNFNFERSTTAKIIDKNNSAAFFQALGNPIRFLALLKHGDDIFGIAGNRQVTKNLQYYTEPYFFRVNVNNTNDFEAKRLNHKLRRIYIDQAILKKDNRLLIGAGPELWKYDLNNFNIDDPEIHKIGSMDIRPEDVIISVLAYDNRTFVSFLKKVKVYGENFDQTGAYTIKNKLDKFKGMTICNGALYIASDKGFIHQYDLSAF